MRAAGSISTTAKQRRRGFLRASQPLLRLFLLLSWLAGRVLVDPLDALLLQVLLQALLGAEHLRL